MIQIQTFSIPAFSNEESNNARTTESELPSSSAIEKSASISNELETIKTENNETQAEEKKKFKYYATLKYAYLDLLIPSKYGFSFGYLSDTHRNWEFEVLHGSFAIPFIVKDLGKMSDTRYSLVTKSYKNGDKFNLNYGLSYNEFSFVIGDKLMNKLSGGSYPSLDLIEIHTLGFQFGLGHRWVFKDRFIISVDWFSWSQPLIVVKKHVPYLDYVTDPNDKKNVEDSIKIISYFPRLGTLKFNIGINF